jgi:hypothetical protein
MVSPLSLCARRLCRTAGAASLPGVLYRTLPPPFDAAYWHFHMETNM